MEQEKVVVKLFVLNESNDWVEKHTGCLLFYEMEREDSGHASYKLVIAEDVENKVSLMEFDICPDISYTRQQETLINWQFSNNEYALSFDTIENCQISYETILKSVKILQSMEESEDIMGTSSELTASKLEELDSIPEFTYANIRDLTDIFVKNINNGVRKEQLALVIEKQDAIGKIVEIFKRAESLEDDETLVCLFIIIKSILSLTKFHVFESLLCDRNIYHIIGILEYNPALVERVKHRELLDNSKFLQLIPFANEDLESLIRHCHRLQYIQDLISPAPYFFEDRSCIVTNFLHFRRHEIVEQLFVDEHFLANFFLLLSDEETESELRVKLLKFIVEMFGFSRMMPVEQKECFIKRFLPFDILIVLEKIKDKVDSKYAYLIMELLLRVAETHPDVMRLAIIESHECKTELVEYLCKQITSDPCDIAHHLAFQVLKLTIDVSNSSLKEEDKKTTNDKFLNCFYTSPICHLMTIVFSYTSVTPLEESSYRDSIIVESVLMIFADCVSFHYFYAKNYIFKRDVLRNIVALVFSKYAAVAHAALMVIRRCLASSDEFYMKYLNEELVLDNCFQALLEKYTRNDMINSTIVELFDFALISSNRSVCVSFVERNRRQFDRVNYVKTFQKLMTFTDNYLFEKESKLNDSFLLKSSSFFNNFPITTRKRKSPDSADVWIESEEPADISQSLSSPCQSEHFNEHLPSPRSSCTQDDGVVLRPVITKSTISISLRRNIITTKETESRIKAVHPRNTCSSSLVDYSDDDDPKSDDDPHFINIIHDPNDGEQKQ